VPAAVPYVVQYGIKLPVPVPAPSPAIVAYLGVEGAAAHHNGCVLMQAQLLKENNRCPSSQEQSAPEPAAAALSLGVRGRQPE
jgi:hypothetical protein